MEKCYFALYGTKWIQPTIGFKTLPLLLNHITKHQRYPVHGIYVVDEMVVQPVDDSDTQENPNAWPVEEVEVSQPAHKRNH